MLTVVLGLLMKWFNPDTIITAGINAYMKAKDVDLAKFQSANLTTDDMVAHILEANVKFAETQASYTLSILNWWPFRVILFALLFFPSLHFILIVMDSTCPVAWDLHIINGKSVGGCAWGVPDIPKDVFPIYQQLLLFFVLAKPVDTAVAGAISLASGYLRKK